MSEPNKPSRREFTPEELAAIYAKYEKQFTVQDLLGYINNTDVKFPAEQVLVEAEELLRQLRDGKQERGQ
jgi:hypothetical protein